MLKIKQNFRGPGQNFSISTPSHAKVHFFFFLQATVKYDLTADQVTVDMTAISHVNKYGDLPHCVIDKNYFLAAYCVCYDKIK